MEEIEEVELGPDVEREIEEAVRRTHLRRVVRQLLKDEEGGEIH